MNGNKLMLNIAILLDVIIFHLQTMDAENETKMKQFLTEKHLLENKHVRVCVLPDVENNITGTNYTNCFSLM